MGNLSTRHGWLTYANIALLIIFALLGVFASLDVGLSWDEDAEFRTYLVNMKAISGLLNSDVTSYHALMQYFDRYYGIGFHLISNGVGSLMSQFFNGLLPFSELGDRLIWGHAVVFLAFVGSGLIFRFCLLRLTRDTLVSSLGMWVFLLWPYLLGHSMMNVKDVPFMVAWLSCTLLVLKISQDAYTLSPLRVRDFALLGILTGWLISIRVSGVLILIEYAWFGIFAAFRLYKDPRNQINLKLILKISLFSVMTCCTLYFLYPIVWHNPLEIFNATRYMSSHPWQGSTLTAGELIEPKTRMLFYIISWFAVKLPIFAIVGLLCLPIAIWRIGKVKHFSDSKFAFAAICLTILTIVSALILMRVSLYNELRQILFIAALLLLISIVSLSWISRSLTIGILTLSIAMMVFDNIELYPYQYSYINEIARNTKKGTQFETDYFGLAVSKTARWLNQSNVDGKSQCLYVPSAHLWNFEINPIKFPCVSNFPGDLSLIKQPFLFYVQARSVTTFSPPPWCKLIHLESKRLPFSNGNLRMGELYECKPVL